MREHRLFFKYTHDLYITNSLDKKKVSDDRPRKESLSDTFIVGKFKRETIRGMSVRRDVLQELDEVADAIIEDPKDVGAWEKQIPYWVNGRNMEYVRARFEMRCERQHANETEKAILARMDALVVDEVARKMGDSPADPALSFAVRAYLDFARLVAYRRVEEDERIRELSTPEVPIYVVLKSKQKEPEHRGCAEYDDRDEEEKLEALDVEEEECERAFFEADKRKEKFDVQPKPSNRSQMSEAPSTSSAPPAPQVSSIPSTTSPARSLPAPLASSAAVRKSKNTQAQARRHERQKCARSGTPVGGGCAKQKAGRPCKYATDAERKDDHKQACRKYYVGNH